MYLILAVRNMHTQWFQYWNRITVCVRHSLTSLDDSHSTQHYRWSYQLFDVNIVIACSLLVGLSILNGLFLYLSLMSIFKLIHLLNMNSTRLCPRFVFINLFHYIYLISQTIKHFLLYIT